MEYCAGCNSAFEKPDVGINTFFHYRSPHSRARILKVIPFAIFFIGLEIQTMFGIVKYPDPYQIHHSVFTPK